MTKRERKTGHYKWSDAKLAAEAAKYTTFGDFLKGSPSAYNIAKNRGIFEKITEHLSKRFTWTPEMIKKEALKYESRTDFFRGSRSAYSAATRMKILEEVTAHMPRYSGRGKTRGPNVRTTKKAVSS